MTNSPQAPVFRPQDPETDSTIPSVPTSTDLVGSPPTPSIIQPKPEAGSVASPGVKPTQSPVSYDATEMPTLQPIPQMMLARMVREIFFWFVFFR